MSTILVDCPAALVAQPRLRVTPALAPAGARLHADDAQPRLDGSFMTAIPSWRRDAGFEMRGLGFGQITKAGRTAELGGAYVTTTKQHSTRSGPPPSRT